MTPGAVFFVFCALTCLVGAVSTVAAKSAIRSAVGLLATVLGIAGLYLQLRAQLLAAVQLIVYAGAVVVLFVFVIMLLGPDARGRPAAASTSRWSRAVVGALAAAVALVAVGFSGLSATEPTAFQHVESSLGSVAAVGGWLYSGGLVPFELTTALLIVAVVGAVAVARGRRSPAASTPAGEGETRRMFGGPVEPPEPTESPEEESR
jgi:NADH-quinone oxidoreductase subunit J